MILTKYTVVCNMFFSPALNLLEDNNSILKWICSAPDFKRSQKSLATSWFETPTFLYVEEVTLNTASF